MRPPSAAGAVPRLISAEMLPLPPHFEPDARRRRSGGCAYEERASDAAAWARAARLRPAADDRGAWRCCSSTCRTRSALPGFELFVPGAAGRQPAALRVRLPEPRRDHADRPDARHAPGDADLPCALARRRGRTAPARRTRSSPRTTSSTASGASTRTPARRSASTRAGQRHLSIRTRALERRRQVRADDLAVPRDARRHRPRARLGRRGGGLLPRGRAAEPARVPGRRASAVDGALLGARARGD